MNYLFGRPVLPSKPRASGRRDVLVLGAYPSALHVRWHPPGQARRIRAIAVDDEPEPFWTGHDEVLQIERWRQEVRFQPSWGHVAPCGRLNGSSGVWVDQKILAALGVDRSDAWITDCLDTYFESGDAAACLAEPDIVSAIGASGVVAATHRSHPSESEIVREALRDNTERLREEFRTARPNVVATLGNAALRVLAALAEGDDFPKKLSSVHDLYAQPIRARLDGLSFEWFPLAHPASPAQYQRAHEAWVASRTATAEPGVAADGAARRR